MGATDPVSKENDVPKMLPQNLLWITLPLLILCFNLESQKIYWRTPKKLLQNQNYRGGAILGHLRILSRFGPCWMVYLEPLSKCSPKQWLLLTDKVHEHRGWLNWCINIGIHWKFLPRQQDTAQDMYFVRSTMQGKEYRLVWWEVINLLNNSRWILYNYL